MSNKMPWDDFDRVSEPEWDEITLHRPRRRILSHGKKQHPAL
jgi:hypothetical protein